MANVVDAMQPPVTLKCAPTKLWRTLAMSKVLRTTSLNGFRVHQMLGSIKDENTFLTMSFSKSKLRSRLCDHLVTCVGIYSHKFYTLETFLLTKYMRNSMLIRNINQFAS